MFIVRAHRKAGSRFAESRPGLARLLVIACFGLAGCCAGHAADVFASTGADGSPRYATQALDSSYHLVYREANPAPAPARPAQTVTSRRAAQLRPVIERIANAHGLAPALVEAIVAVESGYNTGAVSPKGARGAMQLMPATAARYGLNTSALQHDPERNIDAGVRHLKELLVRHNGNMALALAAYNAGSGAVGRYGGRIPPYAETMLYVPAVLARSAPRPAP